MTDSTADADASVFTLPARLDTDAAPSLRAALIEQRGSDLKLDGMNVARVGALCAAVMIAARKTWEKDGFTLTIGEASDHFRNGLERLSLASVLLPETEPAK